MMKKTISVIAIAVLLISTSNLILDASMYQNTYYNAPPGFWDKFGLNIDPSSCRSAVANLAGSGDHLYGSLYDYDDGKQWGSPVETYNATYGHYYFTSGATVSCERWDGAYGKVLNQKLPTEKFANRYDYNYL